MHFLTYFWKGNEDAGKKMLNPFLKQLMRAMKNIQNKNIAVSIVFISWKTLFWEIGKYPMRMLGGKTFFLFMRGLHLMLALF